MRPRYRPPLNRRYFHKTFKKNKRDSYTVKNKIETITQEKNKKHLEEKNNRMNWWKKY